MHLLQKRYVPAHICGGSVECFVSFLTSLFCRLSRSRSRNRFKRSMSEKMMGHRGGGGKSARDSVCCLKHSTNVAHGWHLQNVLELA